MNEKTIKFIEASDFINTFNDINEIGEISLSAYIYGAFNEQRRFYGSDGNVYFISSHAPVMTIGIIQRFISKFVVGDKLKFQLTLERLESYDSSELKDKIDALVKSDPGDLILQYCEPGDFSALKNTNIEDYFNSIFTLLRGQ